MRSARRWTAAGERGAAIALTQLLAPVAPFAAEELWREVLGEGSSVHVSAWPTYDPSLAMDETVTLVVQVNGKVRDKIEVPADISEADAEAAARASSGAKRALDGLTVDRVIVRPPKLVNVVAR